MAGLFGLLALGAVLVSPGAAATQTWRSQQFGLGLSYPDHWRIVDDASQPGRGDVVILGNDVAALLLGLLWDTRTPREMMDDLVNSQKAASPDLIVLQTSETETGSILVFLQYTVHPQSGPAMLIDEKSLLGTLQAGQSTITIRGMVPDRADVEVQFSEIEEIIESLGKV